MIAVGTGGSRGIGAAIVARLAKDGFDVALVYRSGKAEAEVLAKECSRADVRVVPFQADLGNKDEAAGVAVRIREEMGPVTVLVNNAGITRDGLAVRMGDGQFTDVLDTNLTSAFVAVPCVSARHDQSALGTYREHVVCQRDLRECGTGQLCSLQSGPDRVDPIACKGSRQPEYHGQCDCAGLY
jgi:NAD(P)-dependent dehydrogenase (short-subunit alcohol dehydrogenase family)